MNFCVLLGLCLLNFIHGKYLLVNTDDQQVREPKSPAPTCIPPKGKCFTKTKLSFRIEFSARSVKGPAECCQGYACVNGMCMKPQINIDGSEKILGTVGAQSDRCVNSFCPCFGGSNMVHMRNGGRRSISDVKVGDSVLAVDEMGQLRFSQVIMQLHADPEVETKFQVIRTKTGRNLTLTPRHLIYKADSEIASSKPLFAMRIKKGDFVFVFDEKLGMIKDEVVSNDIETEKGLYTPVTSHGNIIVGDILASSYAALENHSLLHLMFAPLRWFNEAKNALSSMEQMEQDEFSKYEHDDKGIHWYAEALLAFGTSIASEKPVCQ